MKKRSVTIAGHATSISLENDFWQALQEIAKRRNLPIAELIAQIDSQRDLSSDRNLSSAIRVYILNYYKNREIIDK